MIESSELFPEVPNLYEFPSIHARMLFDSVRVEAYQAAIHKVVRAGDVVADIGTGTGLLAFLAIQAGASRVHAIERSPAIKWARQLAKANGWADRVVFHEADSRRVNLPERVNVIISELIGLMAFEEGIIESMYDARERLLKPGGRLIPQCVRLRAVPVEEENIYRGCISCWETPILGIKYNTMRQVAVRTCYITDVSCNTFLSEPQDHVKVNLVTSERIQKLRKQLVFDVSRSGHATGAALWFDADLAPAVTLSSAPWMRTHWKQGFAPIKQPIDVNAGDQLTLDIEMILRSQPTHPFDFSIRMTRKSQ
jgi:SAM-dependent methyltransferase